MADDIPTEALEAAARARQEHYARSIGYDFPVPKRPIVDGVERTRGWYWKCTCGAERDEIDLESGYASKAEAEAHENGAILAAAAPHLIAEGRRQAAEAIRAADTAEWGPKRWLVPDVRDCQESAARIAEGTG